MFALRIAENAGAPSEKPRGFGEDPSGFSRIAPGSAGKASGSRENPPRTRVPDLTAPAAPTDLRLRQGDLSGSAIARYQTARSNSMNQVQSCIGDPNVEANWKDAGMFSGGKATVSGIAPGANLWVRVRTAGLKASWAPGATPRRSWWCEAPLVEMTHPLLWRLRHLSHITPKRGDMQTGKIKVRRLTRYP